MSIEPFKSDAHLLKVSRQFFRNGVESFRKDTAICLTADRKRHHAYFPALFTCIAFADFLRACLEKGRRYLALHSITSSAQPGASTRGPSQGADAG